HRLLHLLFYPSLFTLRVAPLLLSLLSIALGYVLFRKRGAFFAASFAGLLAVLPIHLGYARIAWDASAIPLVMVLVLAASTQLRPLWTALALARALWVHPTTAFATPIALAPFAASSWPRGSDGRLLLPSGRAFVRGAAAIVAVVGLGFALVILHALPDAVLNALAPER